MTARLQGGGVPPSCRIRLFQMFFQTLHDLGVGFFHAAHVAAETILIQLLVGLAVPQAAGVGADLVSQNDCAVGQAAEFQLKIHQSHAAGQPEGFQRVVDPEGVVFNGLDLFGGRQLQSEGVIGVEQRVAQLVVL